MGYTHYWSRQTGSNVRARQLEIDYNRALRECAKVIRHYSNEFGGISGYTAHTPIGQYGGLSLNGKGDDGHESMELREHWNEIDTHNFCKTARKPYDILVCASLIILKHRMGNAIWVGSDGNREDWQSALDLVRQVLGLKRISLVGIQFSGERDEQNRQSGRERGAI